MTKKDFFRIIIKLFGLYWLISSLFSTGQFYYLSFIPGFTLPAVLMTILIFLVFLILFYILIFKTDLVIEWLNLGKGFDNDSIEFQNFNLDNILKLGVVIIGGTMILDNIAVFLNQSYLAFKVHTSAVADLIGLNGYSTYHWAVSGTKILLGYLLLTNYPSISAFLLKITQKKEA
ncbi:MAG: hypothetical protein PHT07_20485 [Paludibacter sp.]|nr:hypothetical protein [Paludibacter sp.]